MDINLSNQLRNRVIGLKKILTQGEIDVLQKQEETQPADKK